MKTLTVKLPDGTSDSRKSDRPYTHAIVVVITEDRRTLVLGAIEKTIAEHEAILAANAPLVDLPDQLKAYETAKACLAFLDEEVTEKGVNRDGAPYAFTCARWLSRSYRNQVGTEDERRRGRIDSQGNFYGDTAGLHKRQADEALLATARGKAEAATAALAHARQAHVGASARMTVGRAFVHGWSQSAKNALKAEQEAREANPGAQIYSTTEIDVHVPKARARK
jgi:hypothetical protein